MQLYLLRHAIAVPRGTEGYLGADDSRRPLTPEGVEKMTEAAAGMKVLGLRFDAILSSPLPRAWNTARIVARTLGQEDRLAECAELLPGAPLSAIINVLIRETKRSSILLVGHEPGLSQLTLQLLQAGGSDFLEFKKGGLASLEVEFLRGRPRGRLDWFLSPRLLRTMARP